MKGKWGVCLVIFLMALLPRAWGSTAYITTDEPAWAHRSARFLTALQARKYEETFVVGHPGVTTMWLGTIGIVAQCRLRPEACAELWSVGATLSEDYWGEETLRQLPRWLPAVKLPLAIVVAASIVAIYLLVKRLLGHSVALLSAVLIALDPFYLAHSRVLHLDGLTATFMTLSLLTLLAHLTGRRSWLALGLSGALASLAILSKSSALFMVSFAALALAITAWREHGISRQAASNLFLSFAVWAGVAAITFFLLWPAMWVDPLETVQRVLETGFGYAEAPHENLNFFLGQVRLDPGPGFYPVALLFRMTPLTMLGLAAALFFLLKREGASGNKGCAKKQGASLAALLAYALLFGLFMTLGAKKFDRYLLPIFPALDIVAAFGLMGVSYRLRAAGFRLRSSRRKTRNVLLGIIVLFILQAALVLSYHPYYLAYYNPLLGGGAQAVKTLLVGWGEGMDQVARYLNQKEETSQLRAAIWVEPSFAPFFHGHSTNFHDFTSAKADYVVFYVSDVQRGFHERAHAMFDSQEPEHVVRIHGIDYAWIYRNDHALEVIKYLEGHAQDGDAIVLNTESIFSRQYRGPLPIYVISPSAANDEAQVISELNRVVQQHRRIWYVHYDKPDDEKKLVLYYLTTGGVLTEHQAFPPFQVMLNGYEISSHLTFTATRLHPLSAVNFGRRLKIEGVGFSAESVEAGQSLGVKLQWRAIREMERNYVAALYLMDERGHSWGQVDKPLRDAKLRPTREWRPDELGEEWYLLPVLAGTPPGTYQVQAVVYDPNAGRRLDVLDEKGAPVGTEVVLGTIEVQRPATPSSVEALEILQPLQAQLSKAVQLLGYSLYDDPLTPGEWRILTLFWRALEDGTKDYDVRVQWQDERGHTWAEAILSNAFHPTSQWQKGEIIRGQYDLVVDAAAPVGQATLCLELVEATTGQPLAGSDLALAQLQVMTSEREFTPPPDIAHPQRADLGQRVSLLGYDPDRTVVGPGETLHLTLYWQAQAEMETSYKVFIHLLDAESRIWGQRDSLPRDGARPTTGWLPGEVITDEYAIPVQPGAPPGTYAIEVGIYDPTTEARLPVTVNGLRVPGDQVLLETQIVVR
jgi:hypothetical protein